MKYTKTLLAIAAMSALTMSCSDTEYFDKDAYDKLIKEAFPISDVDPNQDWQVYGSANVNITLKQSGDGECTIRIYDNIPTQKDTHLLAKTTMQSGGNFTASVSYRKNSPYIYITVTDGNNFTNMYIREITSSTFSTVVGNDQSSSTKTRSLTRASVEGVSFEFADNISDDEYPTSIPNDATIPDISTYNASGVYKATGGNDNLVINASNSGNVIYIGEGEYTASSTFYLASNSTLYLLPGAKVTRIGDLAIGQYNSKIVISEGASLIVSNSSDSKWGNLKMSDGASIYNRGTLTAGIITVGSNCILYNDKKGAVSVEGEDDPYIETTNSGQIVNDGTINARQLRNGSAFWNTGTVNIEEQTIIKTNGSLWINEGTFTTNDFKYTAGSSKVINRCKLIVNDMLTINLSDNDGSYNLKNEAYVKTNNIELQANGRIAMASGSMLEAEGSDGIKMGSKSGIIGPESGDYALVKTTVLKGESESAELSGNLAIAANKYTLKNSSTKELIVPADAVKLALGEKKSDVTIIETECVPGYTGEAGTATSDTSSDNSDSGSNTETTTEATETTLPETFQTYRYCYEDNYPTPGDYDFNDCVIDITPTMVSDSRVTYKVDLVAVGASKQIAAAMRLSGIYASQISNVTINGDLYDLNTATSSINTDLIKQKFSSEYTASEDGEAVIYLFNDAHYAFTRSTSSSGSVWRPFINTVKNPDSDVIDYQNGLTPISCEITVDFNDDIAANAVGEDYIDPFIVTEYNGGKWEIHTSTWQTSPALYVYDTSSQYDINRPWALCMPGSFLYPKEWTPIGTNKDGETGGAYPYFKEWAQDMNTYTDWYNYSESDKIYE